MRRNGRLLFFLVFMLSMAIGAFTWLLGRDISVPRQRVEQPVDVRQLLKRDAQPQQR